MPTQWLVDEQKKRKFERRDAFPPRADTQGWVSDFEVRRRVHGRIFLE